MAWAFFDSHCGLPSIDSIDTDFIDDCDIKPAPDPIQECDLPDIFPDPPINPTAFNSLSAPCPEITGDLTLNVTGDATGSGSMVVSPSGFGCGWDFAISLDIDVDAPDPLPPICPTLAATASITVTGAGASGSVSVSVTEVSACSYNFAFTFTFWFGSSSSNSNSNSYSSSSYHCACLPYCDPGVTYCLPAGARLVVNGCGQVVGYYTDGAIWHGIDIGYSSEINPCSSSSSSLPSLSASSSLSSLGGGGSGSSSSISFSLSASNSDTGLTPPPLGPP